MRNGQAPQTEEVGVLGKGTIPCEHGSVLRPDVLVKGSQSSIGNKCEGKNIRFHVNNPSPLFPVHLGEMSRAGDRRLLTQLAFFKPFRRCAKSAKPAVCASPTCGAAVHSRGSREYIFFAPEFFRLFLHYRCFSQQNAATEWICSSETKKSTAAAA